MAKGYVSRNGIRLPTGTFEHLELFDQNTWINNLSKLATFNPILQRPHSAMAKGYCIQELEQAAHWYFCT